MWHEDQHASLNIDWAATLFHCFGCEIGGGVVRLGELVGDPLRTNTRSYLQIGTEGRNLVDKWGSSSSLRLGEALKRLDEGHPDKTRARDVAECGQRFRPGKCSSCAREPAFPINCGVQLCPNCGGMCLAIDWRRHERSLPEMMTILVLRTPAAVTRPASLRKVRARFREWRKRVDLSAGLHGARFERRDAQLSPIILHLGPVGYG